MRFRAILHARCPKCLNGEVFSGLIRLNTTCPVCRYKFMREDGYFVGAMMVNYVLAVLIAVPPAVVLYLLNAGMAVILIVAATELVICSPWLVRYSRILWMHLDYIFDPN